MPPRRNDGYDRVVPFKSHPPARRSGRSVKSRGEPVSAVSGISAIGGDPGGGCETVLGDPGPQKKGKTGLAASVSNRSKVNVLVTILAVIFTQFIICIILSVLVVLHHARIVDWFPSLLEITGEGYLVTVYDPNVKYSEDS